MDQPNHKLVGRETHLHKSHTSVAALFLQKSVWNHFMREAGGTKMGMGPWNRGTKYEKTLRHVLTNVVEMSSNQNEAQCRCKRQM